MNKTPPQGLLNQSVLKTYGNRFVRALGTRLTAAIEPVSILVQGDSTGNDENEWPYLIAQWLAAKFPAYSFNYRRWNDTNQNYDSPERFSIGSNGDAYATLPGAAGGYISTPNSAALQITGDIDLAAKITLPNWTASGTKPLIDKFGDDSPRSYNFYLKSGEVVPVFWWSPDGTTQLSRYATAAASPVNGQPMWFRVTLDVDNEAGGYDLKFYTSSNGTSWTQLGTTIVGASTTAIAANTSPVRLGMRGGSSDPWVGSFYKAIIKNGIGSAGKIVASPDLGRAFPVGTTSFKDAEGNTWTVGAGCTVGNGSPELLFLNASAPGQGLTYSSDVTRFALQAPIEPQLAFINYGHNHGTNRDITATYEGLCTKLLTTYPNTGVVCTAQNPQASTEPNYIAHAIRCGQVAELAAKNNYGLIDVYRAFIETGDYNSLINGVHTTSAGSLLWRDVAIKFLQSAIN